eukprot:scaffold45522_cov21-Tisochrysis_lutea.AAC.3
MDRLYTCPAYPAVLLIQELAHTAKACKALLWPNTLFAALHDRRVCGCPVNMHTQPTQAGPH